MIALGLALVGIAIAVAIERSRFVRAEAAHAEVSTSWDTARACLLGGPLGSDGTIGARLLAIEAGYPRSRDGSLLPEDVTSGSAPQRATWPANCAGPLAAVRGHVDAEASLTFPSTRSSALRRLSAALGRLGTEVDSARGSPLAPEDSGPLLRLGASLQEVVDAGDPLGLARAPVAAADVVPAGSAAGGVAASGAALRPRPRWSSPRLPFPLPPANVGSELEAWQPSPGPTPAKTPELLAQVEAPLTKAATPAADGPRLRVIVVRDGRSYRRGTTVWAHLTGPNKTMTSSLLLVDDAHGGTTIDGLRILPLPKSTPDEPPPEGIRLALHRADGRVSLLDFDAAGVPAIRLAE